jgi:tetratricopeptide (TPR) repeat protein/predicted Ser/Thr protein kinase
MNDCPSAESREAWLAGTLDAPAAAAVGRHVEGCPSCSAWRDAALADDEALVPGVRRVLGDAPRSPGPGDLLEGYRLLRRLGEGGMGVVFEAEQLRPSRVVALKLLRAGSATPAALRRFEHEAEVLARLDHPGIARIFAAGAFDEGEGRRPFLAMELVRGRPLTAWVRETRPSVVERLRLFAEVCDAVHHAHQKGVIHRDLKPSNVLVTAEARPKVLDFGIARAADRELAETRSGQVLGTLPYMSPEQLSGDPDAIDTRTDVHALGVILYELLAGRLPHDLSGRSPPGAVRAILDEEPDPLGAVDASFRGDLETIAGKALRPDKARRYDSAAALADDVRRHLAHEPILARPPSAGYVLAKFARRNRTLVTAGTAVFFVLVAAVIVTTREKDRARAAAAVATGRLARAETEARKFQEVALILEEVLAQADPYQTAGEPSVVRVLERLTRRVETVREPEVEAALRHNLGSAYAALGRDEEAARHLGRALALHRTLEEPAGGDGCAAALARLGFLARSRGDLAEAERLLTEALALRRRSCPAGDPRLAASLHDLGHVLYLVGRFQEAEPMLREAVALLEPVRPRTERLADARTSLGVLLAAQGRFPAGESLLREALELQRSLLAENHPSIAQTLEHLVAVLRETRRWEEAEKRARQALAIRRASLGVEHPQSAAALSALADVLHDRGRSAEAEPLYRQALDVVRRRYGEEHLRTVAIADHLAYALRALGRGAEAEALWRRVLEFRTKQAGPVHPDTVLALRKVAEVLVDGGRAAEAADLLAARLELVRADWASPDRRSDLARLRLGYGCALAASRRFEPAEAELQAAHALSEEAFGAGHALTRSARAALARLYAEAGRPEEAARWR